MRKIVCILLCVSCVLLTACGDKKGKGMGFHMPERSDIEEIPSSIEDELSSSVEVPSSTTSAVVTEVETETTQESTTFSNEDSETTMETTQQSADTLGGISKEYLSAVEIAQTYSDSLHLSRQRLYEQLLNYEHKDFSEDAVVYALDNIDVDYNENALATARNYKSYMGMSGQDIFNLLRSDDGDRFTTEEARYALEHLD